MFDVEASLSDAREKFKALIDYLLGEGQGDDAYLAAGYPIGSGAVEGACRHLVKDRMEGSGMRWRVPGAEAVLKLRAVQLNGDWTPFWQFHMQQEARRRFGLRRGTALPSLERSKAAG